MPITLQFDHPDFPDETEFGVGTIGRVKNHGTLEVDDDAAAEFEATNGMSIQEFYGTNPMYTVNGVQGKAPEKNEPSEETVETPETPETSLPEFSSAPPQNEDGEQ